MSDFIALQQKMHQRNEGVSYCVGFPPWKRAYLRKYLYNPDGKVIFCRTLQQASKMALRVPAQHSRLVCWAGEVDEAAYNKAQSLFFEAVRVEDGFLRSVGLGKYYIAPLSLVFDKRGIYYDQGEASDLEHILQHTDFSFAEIERAGRLAAQIRGQGISKYNVGREVFSEDTLRCVEQARASGKKIILVPGQVANDASLIKGCADICDDGELLVAVRKAAPDDFILYKPHPDVVSGNEQGYNWKNDKIADRIVVDSDINICLAQADAVHTMTSLTGFEALLRGLTVVTYGGPFYAGWGLTQDRLQFSRRSRRLTLEALVAGALIRYPRYYHYEGNRFVTPEQALLTISQQKLEHDNAMHAKKWQRFYRKSKNLLRSFYYGIIGR